MKYSAINIGPIIPTLGMARKPRELWAASLLFSQLMKYVIDAIPNDCRLISPAKDEKDEKIGVGLYPDRIFVKGNYSYEAAKNSITKYAKAIKVDPETLLGYVNFMHIQKDSERTDSEVIKNLNHILDCLELNNRKTDETPRNGILEFIQKGYKSPLFGMVHNDKKYAKGNSTLAEIATRHLRDINKQNWDTACNFSQLYDIINDTAKTVEEITGADPVSDEKTVDEDAFYVKLKENFKKEIKSYHKYICIIQADGDNMGKTFSHEMLKNDKIKGISQKLVEFDKDATMVILKYGGFPIYAGGDDLLFIAPVVGVTKNDNGSYKTILDLIEKIDSCFATVKDDVEKLELKDENGEIIIPSMSYGISISYYKYPLYEAFDSARKQLFEVAKNVKGKNAIAWELKKHSGSSFSSSFSKDDLWQEFKEIINNSNVKDSLVSAVSHKIRQNEELLSLWLDDKDYETRNKCFFEQFLDHKKKDKYKTSVLELLNKLYSLNNGNNGQDGDKKERMGMLISKVYGMLRTAKFIRGEEVIDE